MVSISNFRPMDLSKYSFLTCSYFAGYEVVGMENIPETGALIVYYHGAIPIDVYYFISKVLLLKNRVVHTVADHFLFKIPGK